MELDEPVPGGDGDLVSERLANMTRIVPYWFGPEMIQYEDRDGEIPFDQHMLLAAIAPRPLYVKSNVEDIWAGPDDELLSCKLASPVYELYGMKGVIAEEEIVVNKPYHEGDIGYHRADGGHNLNAADWELFMDFADRYLQAEL